MTRARNARSMVSKGLLHSSRVLDQRIDGASALGVLARVWAWQIWRRIVRRTVLIRCAEGSLLLAPSWSRVASTIAATGLTERDDALFVLDLLRPGDLFVDVGANIGFYTVLASRRGADVLAYEPTHEAADMSERSLALNHTHATVHRVACGATVGITHFTTGLDIGNHIVKDGPGVDVPMTTLDEQLAGREPTLAVLKIDAEGHDRDVMRGGMRTIKRLRPVILIEIWTGGKPELDMVAEYGYRPYLYDPVTRSLTKIAPGYRQEGNLLLISDVNVEAVRRCVKDAQRPGLRAPSVRWLSA